MTILQGDIQLRASQVMLDVDEGGGAPTATQIQDGQSNGVFADVSEVDRAGGSLSARKVFAKVLTANTDSYLGANVILEEPPSDPRVSVTLFSTGSTFDRRTDAMNRVEAYLFVGPAMAFYLLGDHIAGQMTLVLLGQTSATPPVVGESIVLRKFPGQATQHDQYVRITDVTTVTRTFTDDTGDFQRQQVTLELSDQLDADYPGFDPTRKDTALAYTTKTRLFDTVVADAARYYGASALTVPASIGDYSVIVQSIYSALVPSAQVETPIADARLNQQVSALIEAGGSLTLNLTLAFITTSNLYVGGSIAPGTLSVARGGVTLQDKGGLLLNAATLAQAGTVDYANGVLSLTSNVYGTASGTHAVTYKPAATPVIVSQSVSWAVTEVSQRLTYVATLSPLPAKASLQVAYMVQSRWYVLSDDGSGALRGTDSSVGVGTINWSTGTVSLTLGALPDVGSEVIVSWAPAAQASPLSTAATEASVLNDRAFFGVTLAAPIAPGTLTLSWGSSTAADDGKGALTGAAVGEVLYAEGIIRLSPNALPASLTTLTINTTPAATMSGSIVSWTDAGSAWTAGIGAGTRGSSVDLAIVAQRPLREFPGVDTTQTLFIRVVDDGVGGLVTATPGGNIAVGSINYATGAITINKTIAGWQEVQPNYEDHTPFGTAGTDPSYVQYTGSSVRTVTLTVVNGGEAPTPSWAWWSGAFAGAAKWQAAGPDGTSSSINVTLQTLYVRGGYSQWQIGADRFVVNDAGQVQYHVNPADQKLNAAPEPPTTGV